MRVWIEICLSYPEKRNMKAFHPLMRVWIEIQPLPNICVGKNGFTLL